MPGKTIKKVLTAAGTLAFWLLIWWAVSLIVSQELLLPSPWRVAQTLLQMWGTAAFWRAVALSLLRVACGFLSAVAVGALLAVLTARHALLRTLLRPLLYTVRAVPVASFIILLYLWIRVQILPGFVAFLMVLPLVWTNLSEGIAHTDRGLLEATEVYRVRGFARFRALYLPSIEPALRSQSLTALGFAWKAGVAAEVLCYPRDSIGLYLHDAKAHLETTDLFAYTLLVILVSLALEKCLHFLLSRGGAK